MPTVKNIEGPYRVFFYSFDCHEPKHVHISKRKVDVQVLVRTDALSKNSGFAPRELNLIRRLIEANILLIMEAWHEHCGEGR